MKPDLGLDGRALYDFGFALVGDQEQAEFLALQSLCVASADHADNHGRWLCSLGRLWRQTSSTPVEFRSNRPKDGFLRSLTLPERAAVAARFVLHMSPADCLSVLGISEGEESKLLASALQKIVKLKGQDR